MRTFLALILTGSALLAPAGAGAATLANGDFETGNLSGWQVYDSEPGCGSWFAYTGAATPKTAFTFFSPPQGNWAALTDQECGTTSILYQDVALEAGWTHQLSMYAYYRSQDPIAVPSPNSLDDGVEGNQQMRIDVIKPTAPIESLNPEDILASVLANRNGDTKLLTPTVYGANLDAFAGQTIRLRVAVVAGESYFNGGVDGVSIAGAPLPPPPSSAISRGKLTLNKKKGTGRLAIKVPGAGTLTAVAKGKTKRIRKASLTAKGAGAVQVPLKPTAAGRKALGRSGKLKTRIDVTFTPAGGGANTETYRVTLKKALTG